MRVFSRSNLLAAAVTAILLFSGAFLFALTGLYDVSAAREHSNAFHWIVSTAMRRSVQFHAKEVPRPTSTPPSSLPHGAMHFRTMCVACHGEPGGKPSEMSLGLNPKAPELSEVVGRWSDSELHWIITNGIRMTGMPAFGATHKDEEIWALVEFLRTLSGRSPAQYRSLVDSLEAIEKPKSAAVDSVEPKAKPRTWKRKSLF